MQVHTFAAQHAFVHRMVFVSFHMQFAVSVFVYNNTTTNAAVATSRFI
jgi:hypothetical protein